MYAKKNDFQIARKKADPNLNFEWIYTNILQKPRNGI